MLKLTPLIKEFPDISKKDKTVYAGNAALRNLKVDDVVKNIVFIRNEKDGFFPVGWSLVYFLDNEESAELMKQGKIPYLMVPRGTFHRGGSPITDIWKKKFQQPGTEHILGVIEANVMEDSIYIDMITVRPGYQRNKIASMMLEMIKKQYPNAKISTSSTTPKGEKFFKSTLKDNVEYPMAKGKDVQSYGGQEGWKGKIVWTTPQKFLSLVNSLPDYAMDEKSYFNLRDRIKKGLPIDPMTLVVDMSKKKVVVHEGRHRATVSKEMGIEKVPVLIFTGSNFKRVPQWDKDDHDAVDKMDFKPEWMNEGKIG